jgi:hypothetical protein
MKMGFKIILLCFLFVGTNPLFGQSNSRPDSLLTRIEQDSLHILKKKSLNKIETFTDDMTINGKRYPAFISEEGDTILIAEDISYVSISSMRKFSSDEEYLKYKKFRRYANKVYPFAKEAIKIFRELEYAEKHLSKKERKKKTKELEQRLKSEFEAPLKKLTKLQGKIMIKMIERELDEPMYDLIKGLKGRFTAFYWHNFSKLYSYDLKDGYSIGKYPILDAVLQDFDISYKIEHSTDLKYVEINK